VRENDSTFKKLEVLEKIGDCYFEEKEYELEKVLEAYYQVLEEHQNPNDISLIHIYIKIGKAYEKMRLFERAIKSYQ